MIHPIIDNFYNTNPAHERSAGFAQAKGQTVTGPDKQVLGQRARPLEEEQSDVDTASTALERENLFGATGMRIGCGAVVASAL